MTQVPKVPIDLSQILQKVLSLVGLAKAPETDNRIQEMRIVDNDTENHYFTFTKEGELIDMDDDMMMALEQQIRDEYIKSFAEPKSN